MKGRNSKNEYFKNFPNLMYKTYQCSILSTSESIEKAFSQARMLKDNIIKNRNDQQVIVAIILDEIGLAEASKSNPLKVLHSILEDPNAVPMIGISNWKLDESKMNRVVFANRPKLSKEELKEAAHKMQSIINPQFLDKLIVENLSQDSFNYFSSQKNSSFFHGTRDFYNCV
jgi:hypothetical protein